MPGGQGLGYTADGPKGELDPGSRRYNAVWYRKTPDIASAVNDGNGPHCFSLPPGGVPEPARERLVAGARALLPPPFADIFAVEPHRSCKRSSTWKPRAWSTGASR
ncbi:hypothetical protein [Sphingomonas xinjiangensis]|uniref:2,6-dihydroxypyridine 3-monooxygenase substrate binding domain-containing protein n=1 Tax=Sphingomonas xinjiangensis TaxID=643568 RepID=A0A840YP50_9SPHN|nr:hypothetical protein [Sphingomonas xinjiangensis]MBB5709831.1 hypothetical protein [Sphingomonas xinjiangensis]